MADNNDTGMLEALLNQLQASSDALDTHLATLEEPTSGATWETYQAMLKRQKELHTLLQTNRAILEERKFTETTEHNTKYNKHVSMSRYNETDAGSGSSPENAPNERPRLTLRVTNPDPSPSRSDGERSDKENSSVRFLVYDGRNRLRQVPTHEEQKPDNEVVVKTHQIVPLVHNYDTQIQHCFSLNRIHTDRILSSDHILLLNRVLNQDGNEDVLQEEFTQFSSEMLKIGYVVEARLKSIMDEREIHIRSVRKDEDESSEKNDQQQGDDLDSALPESCVVDGCNIGCPLRYGDTESAKQWQERMKRRFEANDRINERIRRVREILEFRRRVVRPTLVEMIDPRMEALEREKKQNEAEDKTQQKDKGATATKDATKDATEKDGNIVDKIMRYDIWRHFQKLGRGRSSERSAESERAKSKERSRSWGRRSKSEDRGRK
ncbi:hypothetical protein DM02DRAFT_647971 [Periconia macrospinosa]|uniref:Uncharacterized protein n=1 Tax=Periconia macrospinosa TaxID=97972 RepID=A0A2V1EGZ7_9PLEO|nr:hypothetical protein DM02DRAFT_647971 [Periconia macrospinosa]